MCLKALKMRERDLLAFEQTGGREISGKSVFKQKLQGNQQVENFVGSL